MPKQRPEIPKKIESDLMFENEHTCCICRERGKDVVFHHIDSNKSNNDPANLVVLCLDCHSKVTGGRGLGRKYSELEIKKYKRDWEYVVRKKRHLILGSYRKMNKTEMDSSRFEIKKYVYELVAVKNPKRTREIMNILDLYYIFDGQSQFILNTLHDVIPVCDESVNVLVGEYIPHYFWHLPGPEHNKIRRKDVLALDKAIDVLTWMGEFNARAMARAPSVRAALRSLQSLLETVSQYRVGRLQKRIERSFQSVRKAALDSTLAADVKESLISDLDLYVETTGSSPPASLRAN